MQFPAAFVTPRSVRAYIERLFPHRPVPVRTDTSATWSRRNGDEALTLLAALDRLDPALVAEGLKTPARAFEWATAIAAIRYRTTVWANVLDDMPLPTRPMSVIYEMLADFPEEVAPRAVARLPFVQDAALRDSIGRDVDAMEPLIRAEQWKAATVIGGSAVEALLLDALRAREVEAQDYAKQQARATQRRWRLGALDKWELWQLVAVSRQLGILDEASEGICNAARGYRNLIHPGVVQRTNNKASLATALNARTAVETLLERFAGGYPSATR